MRDVILSTLEQDAVGNNAKKKYAHCIIDFLDGNAKSYAKCLNSLERMEKYADQNAIVGLFAKMKLEKEEEKKKQEEKKAKYEKERKRKNGEKAKRKWLEKETEELIAAEHVSKGLDHNLTLNVSSLQKNIGSFLWQEWNGYEEIALTSISISHERMLPSFVQ